MDRERFLLPGSSAPTPYRRTMGIVIVNSLLWTAGNGLTTGGFLNYFALELGASASLLGLIAATPETFGISGLASRSLIRLGIQRKALFLTTSLLARAAALLIPLLACQFSLWDAWPRAWLLWGSLAVAAVFQGLASVAYHTWLADAVPSEDWGRLFAWRNIATAVVLLVVPLSGALLRDFWRDHLPPEWALATYSGVFIAGIGLQAASLIPLLRLPEIAPRLAAHRPDWSLAWAVLRQRDTRWLLLHSWCLAAANGLTQAVFFKYQYNVLHLSLSQYYLLTNTMYLVQIATSWLTGRYSVTAGHRPALLWGTFVASCALPFWCLAQAETWWLLFPAFVCWGAFGAVNVAGPNLMLGHAPPGDSTLHLALFRQVAGLLAGLTGILGGLWLDSLQKTNFHLTLGTGAALNAFQVIFLVSWAGRMLAAACVLPVREAEKAG